MTTPPNTELGNDLETRARARVGSVLDDKYQLERLLGVGGMAAVYAARHRNGHRAAVKLLHPEIALDEDVRARFLHEGKAANRVEHPGAVHVIDDDTVQSGPDQGTSYLVMELLEGESVFARVRRSGGVLPEAEVASIADDVLAVLEAAHARGIVHRDLKPDNLFLVKGEDGRERVKVLDFGIARMADASRKTNVGTTLGTPSYMAPEQARGQRDLIDGRTDLFALGATMFRLLTGRRVHDGETSADVLAKMATEQAPPIRSVSEFVSPALAAVIDRSLRFERDERYPDASTMRADLRAARDGAPLPSTLGFAAGSDLTGISRAPEPPTLTAAPSSSREAPTLAASPRADSEQLTVPRVVELPRTRSHPAVVPVPVVATPIAGADAERKRRTPIGLFVGGAVGLLGAVVLVVFLLVGGRPRTEGRAEDELAPHEEATAEPKPSDPDPEPEPAAEPEAPAKPKPSPTTVTSVAGTAKPTTSPSSPAAIAPKPTTTSTKAAAAAPTTAAPPPPKAAPPPPGGPGKSAGKGNGKKK